MKAVLLVSASVLALCAGGGVLAAPIHVLAAPPSVVLVDQNNYPNNQYAFPSDNFTDGTYTSYDAYGADDFVVPSGHRWRIKEVDVTGVYARGSAA